MFLTNLEDIQRFEACRIWVLTSTKYSSPPNYLPQIPLGWFPYKHFVASTTHLSHQRTLTPNTKLELANLLPYTTYYWSTQLRAKSKTALSGPVLVALEAIPHCNQIFDLEFAPFLAPTTPIKIVITKGKQRKIQYCYASNILPLQTDVGTAFGLNNLLFCPAHMQSINTYVLGDQTYEFLTTAR